MVPYPAKTKRRFLICIAAPSRRGTGAGAIFSHLSSGAGKSAKVAESFLWRRASLFEPLTVPSCQNRSSFRAWAFCNNEIKKKDESVRKNLRESRGGGGVLKGRKDNGAGGGLVDRRRGRR